MRTITTTVKTEQTAASGIALGGIGSGGLEIRSDGRLYCWNFVNAQPWTQLSPHNPGKGNHRFPHYRSIRGTPCGHEAGLVEEGDRIIDMVFDRHVGEGMRWDHAECSNHYARPLSIWGAYAARMGVRHDGYRQILTIEPPVKTYRGGLVLAQAMATMDYAARDGAFSLSIKIEDGELALSQLKLATEANQTQAELTVNGQPVEISVARESGLLILNPVSTQKLKIGDALGVKA